MASNSGLNGSQPKAATPGKDLPPDLFVMAALVGISRALFGEKSPIAQKLSEGLRPGLSDDRGRQAEKPADIPKKGWLDIAWRVFAGIQEDRVLLVAAGVTFYTLLALFPATAAIVSLYGLFSDASTLSQHLNMVSGFLPDGALAVIGDQVTRITSHGQTTLGLALGGTLLLALWGANAGTKAMRAPGDRDRLFRLIATRHSD